MSENIKLNGVIINEQSDPRDYNVAMFVPGEDIITDEDFCLKLPKLNIIINQKQYGACVGHAFALAKSILEYNRTNKWIDIDPFMIYGTRYEGEYIGVGMEPRQGAKTLLYDGAFLRRDFGIEEEVPQLIDTVKKWKQDNPDKVKEAKNLVISAYCFNYDTNEIKRSLKNGMPVCVAYPIYSSFYNTGDDGIVSLKTNNDKLEGYHEMLIVGWTKNDYWIVLNSWGSNYGFKGVYFIPFKYKFNSAIAVSDTITPSKYKAKHISFKVNDKQFEIDGQLKEFDVAPYIKQDRTYVSVRFITEALGASVEWLPDTREVIIRSEEGLIKMTIDNRRMTINGKLRLLTVAPEIKDDRTMLPIRFVAEALNCKVGWDNGKVTIDAL